MNNDWHDLIQRHMAGLLDEEEATAFQSGLKSDPDLRKLYLHYMNLDVALEAHAGSSSTVNEMLTSPYRSEPRRFVGSLSWRPLAGVAAGLVFGMFCASLAWAFAVPKITSEGIEELGDGGFERGSVGSGFPKQTGAWGGDDAEIVSRESKERGRCLHFISPGADLSDPSGRAISCDVFQIVDLRRLRSSNPSERGDVLELSASFLDARAPNTNPSVTFICQLYVFSGEWSALHATWPQPVVEALGSGTAQTTTLGSHGKDWRTLTAKCFLPRNADFAVVQIAARPNIRPAKLDGIYADDVRLTLKTSPELPIRIVQH
jgi:hypothetical protein